MSVEQKTFVENNLATHPKAFSTLISDLKTISAYETSAVALDQDGMKKAFNNLSWSDANVQAALPAYLSSTGEQRARVDYAYNALFPRTVNEKDAIPAAMGLWMKARLHSYDSVSPFQVCF